ncbi:hypothetical protein HX878_31655 [Pseudomonas veronii]|uniref:hypothetical protein n=1 Tax=Pseudomonas veronii TaxID=76761 RepID=UPI0015A30314|nr:hypothetical protein [Pseudomonas veronii]NWD59267.1 hypothetical protein [Pseudomonas veronii]
MYLADFSLTVCEGAKALQTGRVPINPATYWAGVERFISTPVLAVLLGNGYFTHWSFAQLARAKLIATAPCWPKFIENVAGRTTHQ